MYQLSHKAVAVCCVCTECNAYGGTRNGVTTVARNTCLNEDSPAFMTKADLEAIAFGCVFGCRQPREGCG